MTTDCCDWVAFASLLHPLLILATLMSFFQVFFCPLWARNHMTSMGKQYNMIWRTCIWIWFCHLMPRLLGRDLISVSFSFHIYVVGCLQDFPQRLVNMKWGHPCKAHLACSRKGRYEMNAILGLILTGFLAYLVLLNMRTLHVQWDSLGFKKLF